MILSANQPYFAPFPGFFYKAHRSDIFVLLDQVQFPRGTTWINRNRFKNDKGTLWITVPVWRKGLGLQSIHEVKICTEGSWQTRHMESLKTAYAHSPFIGTYGEYLMEALGAPGERLVDLNTGIIKYLVECLGIETKILLQSELGVKSRGAILLTDLCKATGCSTFLAQTAAHKYLEVDLFRKEGIELKTLRYPDIIYPQLWGDFVPNLSTFDLLFNCGPKARDIILG